MRPRRRDGITQAGILWVVPDTDGRTWETLSWYLAEALADELDRVDPFPPVHVHEDNPEEIAVRDANGHIWGTIQMCQCEGCRPSKPYRIGMETVLW